MTDIILCIYFFVFVENWKLEFQKYAKTRKCHEKCQARNNV